MSLTELLIFNNETDIYGEIRDYISRGGRIFVWGAGSVAVGVKRECEKQDIEISGFFVDVENYNHDSRIGNEEIYQLKQLLSMENSFSVIVGHSRYELASTLKAYEKIERVYCLSDVARDDIAITKNFFMEYEEAFHDTYNKLADDLSKKNMAAYLNAKFSKDESIILDVFEAPGTYFENDIMQFTLDEVYLDVGAYDGESIKKFMKKCSDFKQILAVEVMPLAYKKLLQKYGEHPKIRIYNTGVSDHVGEERFAFNDQSTCIAQDGEGTVMPVTTLDALCADVNVSIIKMCIGNTIMPLLVGAKEILSKYTPKLIITAGIDKRALIDYIPQIEALAGKNRYKYYLRFTNAMMECLVLYGIPG